MILVKGGISGVICAQCSHLDSVGLYLFTSSLCELASHCPSIALVYVVIYKAMDAFPFPG